MWQTREPRPLHRLATLQTILLPAGMYQSRTKPALSAILGRDVGQGMGGGPRGLFEWSHAMAKAQWQPNAKRWTELRGDASLVAAMPEWLAACEKWTDVLRQAATFQCALIVQDIRDYSGLESAATQAVSAYLDDISAAELDSEVPSAPMPPATIPMGHLGLAENSFGATLRLLFPTVTPVSFDNKKHAAHRFDVITAAPTRAEVGTFESTLASRLSPHGTVILFTHDERTARDAAVNIERVSDVVFAGLEHFFYPFDTDLYTFADVYMNVGRPQKAVGEAKRALLRVAMA